jgi:transposase InsO family protein
VTRFGCPRIFLSDQGTHFINSTIKVMTEEFKIHHKKRTPYHLQENGIVEDFNKSLENALTKICNVNRGDWVLKVSAMLWAYKTICKKLTRHTPFRMVYGQEVVVPLDYLVPGLCIVAITNMIEECVVQERLDQLMELEEDRILVVFHHEVQKAKDKSWHDRHIKKKIFREGDLVLPYDSRYLQHPSKFNMHWLEPYQVEAIINGGVVQLKYLVGKNLRGLVNGSGLKLYQDN